MQKHVIGNIMNEYRFHLQKYKPGSKTVCPGCGRKSCFTRYIDEAGEISFPGYVGKCDHVNSCGYHYSPKEYFRDNPSARETSAGHKMNGNVFTAVKYAAKQPPTEQEQEISYLPYDLVEQSMRGYDINPLYRYFTKVAGKEEAGRLFHVYKVGTSRMWNGSTVFWQIDVKGNVRAGKIMGYDAVTGHRIKEPFNQVNWVHSVRKVPDFHMNSVVRQLHEQGTDIVMVDTGNSYEGLCEYLGGKYISYTEERPITMNPFRIHKEEMNVEKTGFLKNLVLLIWKGTQGTVTKTEDRLVENVITDYYDAYFNGFDGFTPMQREDLRKSLAIDERNRDGNREESEQERNSRIECMIDEMERRRKELKVEELSFNSFYEYSVQRIPDICHENHISGIDLSTYRYMMKDFYRGGNHEKTLNENMDSSLFDETFVVFEIDSIKDDPLLFPLVTLIIMDVFLQKMRIKKNRKVLVIEEAWKAIASPLMAEYIKFMYKTARKFWASVGVVTQEIQDIIGSEIVKEAIINNSDVVMLLDQSKFKERFDTIKAILGLTDVDCKKIFTINRLDNKDGRSFFREVFIRRGTTSGVYGVEEPHECYMTYTTERAEKEALKLYKRELRCSHQEAIEAYCRDWDASGISKSLTFAQKVNEAGRVLNLKAKQ